MAAQHGRCKALKLNTAQACAFNDQRELLRAAGGATSNILSEWRRARKLEPDFLSVVRTQRRPCAANACRCCAATAEYCMGVVSREGSRAEVRAA